MKKAFWRAWCEADEFEKLELVEGLTGVNELNRTLINSYFVDLQDYLNENDKISSILKP